MTTATQTIEWQGTSGENYKYYVHPIKTTFKAVPGNYIFSKESKPNTWVAIYIGETIDLSERFDNHHKMPCILRNGATHIHIHASSSDVKVRTAEEADLIPKWNPTCND